MTQEPEGKITYGLTIHCDLLLSNNLEINWGGTTAQARTTSTCSSTRRPWTAATMPPASRLPQRHSIRSLAREGKFNGDEGFSITFTFIDGGEPGVDDQIAFRITRDSNGEVILNVPLTTVSGGNLQAHFDQPHKSK